MKGGYLHIMSFTDIKRFLNRELASVICLLIAYSALMYALISPFLNLW